MNAASTSRAAWYARRLARMSPAEMAWRTRDQAVKAAWSRRRVTSGQLAARLPPLPPGPRRFTATLPPGLAAQVPAEAKAAVLAAAGRLLQGEWECLGVPRTDLARPDWFYDPVTGRRSAPDRYAFRIDHRSEDENGNIKQLWEISRLQHLTLLATAWFLTGEEPYARRVAGQLRSWWQENPFLSGIHWTSGIEIGLRLISMVWIRRLLDGWPGAPGLFELDPLAVRQIRWHQEYLAAFRSRGSSANNHVIAEAAGQLTASCAFGWFPASERWRRHAARLLERELLRNTFPSGAGRELASDYHCFVAELGLVAAVEAEASGHPLSATTWRRLCAMVDCAAALVDERLRPPRQGDSDEGRAVLLDAPAANRWPALLSLGQTLVGRLDWWPRPAADAASPIIGALARGPRDIPGRPARRPSRFPDAGITLLRTPGPDAPGPDGPGQDALGQDGPGPDGPEIWCRCDGGPHGFLSIAAHAHADALSVEVRHGGIDVLADPGTYCYHGELAWRSYFRSTIAHNTAELAGRDQSASGGPFLWTRHARTRELEVSDDADVATWSAEHDGYGSLDPPARHRRSVRLDRRARTIEIADQIDGGSHDLRLAFHLGPLVEADIDGAGAVLAWPGDGAVGAARLELPDALRWRLHRGQTDPPLGWYSPALGQRIPAAALIGSGRCPPGAVLTTRLHFLEPGRRPVSTVTERRIIGHVRRHAGERAAAGILTPYPHLTE